MKASIIILGFTLLISCQERKKPNGQVEPTAETEKIRPIYLIGHTVVYRYGESVYHVTFDSASQMHWEAISGEEIGTREEETYKMHRLDDLTLFITWGEANGTGVSQVLDFRNGIVYNHLLRGRDVDIMTGEITILENGHH